MRRRIKIIRRFEDRINNQTYLVGEVFPAPEEFARQYVLRGDAEFIDGINDIPIGIDSKVSIVILIKDALEYVKKCIDSLLKYTENFELIIIDNDSSSQTKKYLKSIKCNEYTIITNTENRGFSYGCNQGIKVAKYDYICFLNSDTLLSPGWLSKLMKGFKYHEAVGIVGPSTCRSATIQSPQVWEEFKNAGQDGVNKISTIFKEDYQETHVVGFCFVIAKKVFDKIGVFDYKRYGIACGEDMDLVWRAQKAGFKSLWCKGSYVHHFGNCTTKEMGLDPHAIRVKNTPILFERMKDTANLYVENDVKIPKFKQITSNKTNVIIPIQMTTYNRLPYTKRVVAAIFKNTDLPFKLFIFDNASTDGTQKWLKTIKDSRVEIYYSEENTGLMYPKNWILKKYPDTEYISFVDNDSIMPHGWLSKLKDVMDNFPLFNVMADHYLGMPFKLKNNQEFYEHLYSIDFKGEKLYLYKLTGGTGSLIRRQLIKEPIPEMKGTLGGWGHYCTDKFYNNNYVSAFYTGVFNNLCDMTGTNQKIYEFPEYKIELQKIGRSDFARREFDNQTKEMLAKIKDIIKQKFESNKIDGNIERLR